jgi:hypothetical protein
VMLVHTHVGNDAAVSRTARAPSQRLWTRPRTSWSSTEQRGPASSW